MTYLLDTDHVSILEHESGADYAVLLASLSAHPADAVGVTVVSFHEQLLGSHTTIQKAKSDADVLRGYRELYRAINFFRGFPLAPFDAAALAASDQLEAQKVRIRTMDRRIAAVALSRNLTLLTRNCSDFDKVPGLRVEDWTR